MLIEVTNVTVGNPPEKRAGLQKLFAAKQASLLLTGITATFPRGINVVLGPNGSGKTILLQVLSGNIRPDSGSVAIDGKVADPLVLRNAIGYLPQTFGLYPQLSARETLDYIALIKGITVRLTRQQCVERILQQTGLVSVAEHQVGTYSRGMRQKVGIAQALIGNPPVLLLDEPTAGLDPEERNKLRGLLSGLGQERVIVWASSLITDTGCADQILVVDRGNCRFSGTPAELANAANSSSNSLPLKEGFFDYAHWADVLETGYRTVLSVGERRP